LAAEDELAHRQKDAPQRTRATRPTTFGAQEGASGPQPGEVEGDVVSIEPPLDSEVERITPALGGVGDAVEVGDRIPLVLYEGQLPNELGFHAVGIARAGHGD